MSRRYDASEIEPKWVKVWENEGLYRGSEDASDTRPRFYALDMFPYPSGDLHMGHAEAFSGGDAVARFKWMQGYNVLHPIGWSTLAPRIVWYRATASPPVNASAWPMCRSPEGYGNMSSA